MFDQILTEIDNDSEDPIYSNVLCKSINNIII